MVTTKRAVGLLGGARGGGAPLGRHLLPVIGVIFPHKRPSALPKLPAGRKKKRSAVRAGGVDLPANKHTGQGAGPSSPRRLQGAGGGREGKEAAAQRGGEEGRE
eukprot:13784683-Alexandrium_andersonii.AAC.1